MTKSLLLATTLLLLTFQSRSQYGSLWAGYPASYELSSGFATQNTPGYFWLGYLSNVQNIPTSWHVNKNFCIMGSGQSSIWASYKVYESNGCSGGLTQVLNGNGVSAIESSLQSGAAYALAGVYDRACYFVTLDKSGNVLNSVAYPFPSPKGVNQHAAPSRPLIAEAGSTGNFFICGRFESEIYILNVNSAGSINWSRYYAIGNEARPRDILVNPYVASDLLIVGDADLSNGDTQGFFLSVDGASGQVNQARTYGCAKSADGFGSIAESKGGLGSGKGFVIGGYTDRVDGNPGSTAWTLKLDMKGNPVWSNVIHPVKGNNKGVIDLIYRLNTLGSYEYYALLDSDAGMHVLKLDEQGTPFPPSAPLALNNEFIYDLPANMPSKGNSLSCVNNPAQSVNVGLQVFGTAYNLPGFASSYIVNAFFNGETNCYRSLTAIQDVGEGSMQVDEVDLKPHGALTACTNFQVIAYFPGGSLNYPCLWQTLSGSNQRSMVSGNDALEAGGEEFSVAPNPVSDKTHVTYTAADNSKISIEVYNLLGQQIFHAEPFPGVAGTYKEEIDFNALNVKSGVYLVNTTVDGKLHTHKIMYTR